MQLETVATLIACAAALAAIVFGYFGYRQGIQKQKREEESQKKDEGEETGTLKADTTYIKRRIDDVLLEQKDTNKSINALAERVTRVEESSKQAHKRIDDNTHDIRSLQKLAQQEELE